MSGTPRLDSHRRYRVTSLLLGNSESELCSYAKPFKTFTTTLLAAMQKATHSVHVNRAKLLLTDQYFRVKRTVPSDHQDTSTYNGHPCIYSVFCETYDELDRIAIRVLPPAFEIPPKPPTRSRKKKVTVLEEDWSEDILHKAIYGDGNS